MATIRAAERRGVLLFCSAVILIFNFADMAALGRFSPVTFWIRVVWAALTAWAAFRADVWTGAQQHALFYAVGIWTAGFFAVLVWLTGGSNSPLFHWILAMPVLVAVCLQEFPPAALASSATLLLTGIGIQLDGRIAVPTIIAWTVQAAAMSTLAWYAARTYEKLRRRERDAARYELEALAHSQREGLEREARTRAENLVRSRDEFLTVASHELKSPLTVLNLHVQSAQARRGQSTVTDLSVKMDKVAHQTRRLVGIVETLVNASRVQTLGMQPTLEKMDISDLTREVVERTEPIAAKAGCPLVFHPFVRVQGTWDRMHLDHILTSLLSNAVKFGAGRPVTLSVLRQNSHAILSVRDEGIGIAARDQARIFERYERAVSTRHYGGLGVGLWLCRELVNGMNGDITVDSRPGHGSEFTVRLPIQLPKAERV